MRSISNCAYRQGSRALEFAVVEIIGDGDVADIEIAASGKHAILFNASMGRIVNLTLKQTGGGKFYGVDIAQGRVDVELSLATNPGILR
jgi:hypothetical protein